MTPTTDKDYADLLASLGTYPAQAPIKREMTRKQEHEWLAEDLMAECGEAVW